MHGRKGFYMKLLAYGTKSIYFVAGQLPQLVSDLMIPKPGTWRRDINIVLRGY